jgi:Ca2+-binding RTX toxin-like protein
MTGYHGDDVLEGGAGNDILQGENNDDVLTGGLDADSLWGGKGDDTYIWASGDGNDEIAETSGSDILKMTGGITASDLTFVGGASQNLEITYTPTGEVITVKDHHYHSYQDFRIETIEFDDGSTYSLHEGVEWTGTTGNDVLKAGKYDDTLTGDSGNDKLYGYAGNDSMTGGIGNDTLYGDIGDDTYVWASGDGNDTIQEASSSGGAEVLLLTGGIVAADVTFADSGNHLIITHTSTSETITIKYQNYYDSDYHVETLAFDDGSTVDLLGV